MLSASHIQGPFFGPTTLTKFSFYADSNNLTVARAPNGFPDGYTNGAVDSKRAFFIGNVLFVGIVKCIAECS